MSTKENSSEPAAADDTRTKKDSQVKLTSSTETKAVVVTSPSKKQAPEKTADLHFSAQ